MYWALCMDEKFKSDEALKLSGETREIIREKKNLYQIELIDLDHDAGDYASDGGDYIKLLDWLEETGRNYPVRFHTANPVGRANMELIAKKNGWKIVYQWIEDISILEKWANESLDYEYNDTSTLLGVENMRKMIQRNNCEESI